MSNIRRYFHRPGRAACCFIDNLAVRVFGKKPYCSPLLVALEITNACNAKCKFCDKWYQNNDHELTTNELIEVIKQLGKLKTWMLAISGGEPLIYKHLDEVLYQALRERIIVSLSTNGYHLKERAPLLIKNRVRYTTISADSNISSIHDNDRRLPGLFEKIHEGIEEFKRLRIKSLNNISIRIIVHSKNIHNLDSIIRFWKQHVDDISLIPISYGNKADNRQRLEEFVTFRQNDFHDFEKIIKIHNLNSDFHRSIPDLLLQRNQSSQTCFSGSMFLSIAPNGDVGNCHEYHHILGNIKNQKLINVLQSDHASCVRKKIKQGVPCSCISSCAMINSYLAKLKLF